MRIKEVPIIRILDLLGKSVKVVYGPTDGAINNLADIEHVNAKTLDWINPNKEAKQEIAEGSPAMVLLVDGQVQYSKTIREANKTLIVVDDPKLALSQVGNAFFVDVFISGIHPFAVVSPEAEMDPTATIAPFAFIGKAKIGKNTVICSGVRIYDSVIIGDNCYIKEGAVIGGPGFGYEIGEDGNHFRFPQIGGVIIGNNVDIGANTCVDRGALSDTIIEDYVKIDNLCHIAHNAHIGKNTMIVACSEVSGSCKIGEKVWVGPNSSVRDWKRVGNGSFVGMASNVVKDIPENEVWAGNPAKKMR